MLNVGALVLIDHHEPVVVNVNTGRRQVKAIPVGNPTGGIEDDICRIVVVDPITVDGQHHQVTAGVTVNTHQPLRHPQTHPTSHLFSEALRDLAILVTQHPARTVDNGHLGPEPREDVSELRRDKPATKDHQTLRKLR